MITTIFAKQRELMEKYEQIEHDNGFMVPSNIPLNINDKFDQLRLKDFAWRITEELSEAIEQIIIFNEGAAKEELADVLHFLAEFTILLGMEDIVIPLIALQAKRESGRHYGLVEFDDDEKVFEHYGQFTYHLAMACHELKNKPWKQSHRDTDVDAFIKYFKMVWADFLRFCEGLVFTTEELFKEYHKKHQINQTRQETGY